MSYPTKLQKWVK